MKKKLAFALSLLLCLTLYAQQKAEVAKDATAMAVTGAAAGEGVSLKADPEGRLFVRTHHPNRIHCVVVVSTAITVQAVGGSCATPGAGNSIYVTDIAFGTSAAAGVAADSFPTLKYGTGGTCSAGTTVVWQALTAANTTVQQSYHTPIKVPANNELCWIMTTAGSKVVEITGYIAP